MDVNCVPVKVFLMDEEKRIDVRRFNIPKDIMTSYENLCGRFLSCMLELQQRVFKLLWLDSDGDEVTITSDEDLIIAVTESRETICKFIIRLVPIAELVQPVEDKYDPIAFLTYLKDFLKTPRFCKQLLQELHTQRVCDSCSKLILSTSFKCLQCPYYYQCHECDENNSHPNHIMLRINKEWVEQQKIHQQYIMCTEEREAMEELRRNLKIFEEKRKKQKDGGYSNRGRIFTYKVIKKTAHRVHHILTHKKVY